MPDQVLPIADALWDYTMGAAYAGAGEYLKGSLTLDKLGDAVILLILPQEQIASNGAQATIVSGKVV